MSRGKRLQTLIKAKNEGINKRKWEEILRKSKRNYERKVLKEDDVVSTPLRYPSVSLFTPLFSVRSSGAQWLGLRPVLTTH